jgi:hypothetical protein
MFGDDVGYWNPSIYNRGMMGYRTPNIDPIAHRDARRGSALRRLPTLQPARGSLRARRPRGHGLCALAHRPHLRLVPAQVFVRSWLESFREFPPRQKPGSFNLGDALEKLTANTGG